MTKALTPAESAVTDGKIQPSHGKPEAGPGLDETQLVWMAHPDLDEEVLMPRSFLHPSNNADSGWTEVDRPAPADPSRISPDRAPSKEK